MTKLIRAAPLADELDRSGFIRLHAVFDANFMDSLLLRAHATLFRESADAREAVKSNGSLIHLADNPEYADVIASPALLERLRLCGATDPRFTGGFLISKPGGGPPLFWHQDWWGWDDDSAYQPRAQQLFAMIYLTDTNFKNGCLRVIPGHTGTIIRCITSTRLIPKGCRALATRRTPPTPTIPTRSRCRSGPVMC